MTHCYEMFDPTILIYRKTKTGKGIFLQRPRLNYFNVEAQKA